MSFMEKERIVVYICCAVVSVIDVGSQSLGVVFAIILGMVFNPLENFPPPAISSDFRPWSIIQRKIITEAVHENETQDCCA